MVGLNIVQYYSNYYVVYNVIFYCKTDLVFQYFAIYYYIHDIIVFMYGCSLFECCTNINK